ncbi:sterile alpha motif domain-containing protein 1-like [Lathamus discolor]|uniref:sterile alpha motif domain-containing protein 1-like n=1 Tax=Lathamus discolor TaxID=678569 RepID=UPI0032B840F9
MRKHRGRKLRLRYELEKPSRGRGTAARPQAAGAAQRWPGRRRAEPPAARSFLDTDSRAAQKASRHRHNRHRSPPESHHTAPCSPPCPCGRRADSGTPRTAQSPPRGLTPPPRSPRGAESFWRPEPHRSLRLPRAERQLPRPMVPRPGAPVTSGKKREAGPRQPPARSRGGSASRSGGTATGTPVAAPHRSRPVALPPPRSPRSLAPPSLGTGARNRPPLLPGFCGAQGPAPERRWPLVPKGVPSGWLGHPQRHQPPLCPLLLLPGP